MNGSRTTLPVLLQCEGLGDCLCAVPILRKIRRTQPDFGELVLFTHHPELFVRCPYVDRVLDIMDGEERKRYDKVLALFDPSSQLKYPLMDTIDYMSIPIGMGQLSFREKQLEYFPAEPDNAQRFDVVLNTSMTWPSRNWPVELWQRLADALSSQGYAVAVVGKDVHSSTDNMRKTSPGLAGCVDLTNRLSLDQTYFTIAKAGLFVTCQNGLSVLSGATDTEVMVLDRSIEWSKYALYRREDPHYRFSLVKGNCDLYCCASHACAVYGEFRCIPGFDQVWAAVSAKLSRGDHGQDASRTRQA
ncbi:MAG TPA: glycosyltransferase family 9 protein [Casimicrobiaceae bacterium]|nr:glycosyltransferase family 9 protein [Casimicrobiaceae bacterium]